jgi:hypothetical protein
LPNTSGPPLSRTARTHSLFTMSNIRAGGHATRHETRSPSRPADRRSTPLP